MLADIKKLLLPAEQDLPKAPSRVANFIYLHQSTLKQEAIAVASLFFILFLFRYKAFLSINSAYLGGFERDAGLYIWLIKSNLRDLFQLPWFNTSAFFPYARSLAWSDNFILPSLLCWPFLKIGLSLPLVYNTLLLGANFLNGYLTYRLAYRLTGKGFPSIISGAAFMTFSYLSSHLGHPQLQFAFWIPVAFGFLFRFLYKPSLLSAYLMGLSIFLCFLTTVYYSIFSVIGIGSILLAFFLLKPRQFVVLDYLHLFIGSLLGFLPCLFFIEPYFDVRSTFGSRHLYEASSFAANLLSYFTTSGWNLLYQKTALLSHPEKGLFPGFLIFFFALLAFRRTTESKKIKPLAIAILFLLAGTAFFTLDFLSSHYFKYLAAFCLWGLLTVSVCYLRGLGVLERKLGFHMMSNRGLIASFLFAALIFFAISLGPLGRPIEGQFAPGFFWLFYKLLPGMNSIRAISRIGVFSILCLILVLPFSLTLLMEKKKWGRKFCFAVLALVLIENYNINYPLEGEVSVPTAVNYLKEIAQPDDVVIALPFTSETKDNGNVKSWGDFARLNVNYMHWLHSTGLTLVNGYSGQRSRIMLEYPRKMSGFPDQRSINTLGLVSSLRYVLYDSRSIPNFNKERFLKRAASFSSRLTRLMEDDQGVFLFEFQDRSRVKREYFLQVPSYPKGLVHLELMALSNTNEAEVMLDVYIRKYYEETPYAAVPVKTDGSWQFYTFTLPKTEDRVRPLFIYFKPKANDLIYIQARKWQAAID